MDAGRARALEALLPSELGGSPVVKRSFSGERLAGSPAGEGFVDVLRELGVHPRAASFAFATNDDQDAIGAMRAVGASPQDLVREFVDSSKEKGAKVSQATIGGKRVTVVSKVKGLPGREYVYAQGDTVFFVVADENVATEALAALP